MIENFASYKETTVATIIKTTHTLNIWLNAPAGSIKETLCNVPNNAVLTAVYEDDENGIGELVFTEEKEAL